jgi:hypothetical protein
MRTLLFKNNVHSTDKVEIPGMSPAAVNLTVRKGLKWSSLEAGDTILLAETEVGVVCGAEVYAKIFDVKVITFRDLVLYPKMLELEHDPECRIYYGLYQVMRKVYDGFLAHEIVTLVYYEIVEDKS